MTFSDKQISEYAMSKEFLCTCTGNVTDIKAVCKGCMINALKETVNIKQESINWLKTKINVAVTTLNKEDR